MKALPDCARLLTVALSLAACADRGPAPASGNSEPTAALGTAEQLDDARRAADRLLDTLAPFVTAPALSAAVMTDGELAWTGTQGLADVEAAVPVSPTSRFRLASVSKLFTATLALQLIELGQLDPDADVRQYVPSWPEGGETITARQLAAHIAGINHYESMATSSYVEGRHYPDILEALSFFSTAPLVSAPGEAYSYSSFGYALLNAVTQGASGMQLADSLERLIFQPLGLEHTGLEDARQLPPSAVTLYRQQDGQLATAELDDQSFVWGATGMRSTPSDLVRFGHAFLSGELVSAETRDWALAPARLDDGSPVADDRYAIGFGWRVSEDWSGRPVAHHAGSTRGARSILLGYPKHGTVVALLVNGTWTSRIETTAELIAAAFMEEGFADQECTVGEWQVAGTLDGAPTRGTLSIRLETASSEQRRQGQGRRQPSRRQQSRRQSCASASSRQTAPSLSAGPTRARLHPAPSR